MAWLDGDTASTRLGSARHNYPSRPYLHFSPMNTSEKYEKSKRKKIMSDLIRFDLYLIISIMK